MHERSKLRKDIRSKGRSYKKKGPKDDISSKLRKEKNEITKEHKEKKPNGRQVERKKRRKDSKLLGCKD